MNHTNLKRVVLPIAALVALVALFSVLAGASASASRGATAETPCCAHHAPSQATFPTTQKYPSVPCCQRHTPSQAAFSTSSSQLLAGQPCCQRHAPSQLAFQSVRTSDGASAATTARSRGRTATQST